MDDTFFKLISTFENSFSSNTLVKMTLGKMRSKTQELKNIFVRPVEIRKGVFLSFTYRYQTRDEVKNYSLGEAVAKIEKYFGNEFMKIHLFTIEEDFELSINKKKKCNLRTHTPAFTKAVIQTHDHHKKRYVNQDALWLHKLEITDEDGNVRPTKTDKFKQINKYIEVLEPLLEKINNKSVIKIADMGSGKGYLTFALYDYLKNIKQLNVEIKGVEQRQNMIDLSNKIAQENNFKNLSFHLGSINDFKFEELDVLIALHACDTATDDAIYKGIEANADLILCAPCCHKQVRKQISAKADVIPMLKYGILMERQAEMLTDTIRALIMELEGYDSKIFEFISNEHTGKNLMISGLKSKKEIKTEEIQKKIKDLKSQYGIEYHYLEKLLEAR